MKCQLSIIPFTELKKRMNDLGRSRTPFVWGADYDCRRGFVVDNPHSPDCGILWDVRGRGNSHGCQPHSEALPHMRVVAQPERIAYGRMFDTVMAGLRRGDSFLANLTARTEVECQCGLDTIFRYAKAPYKLLLPNEFVCFSPEPFVRISGNRISTYPMKGTADASLPDAESLLMENYKEMCEHYTIVDLMRNDLNSVSRDVRVERFRYLERIATSRGEIFQTSSEVTGVLPEGKEFDFGDIILPMLPAGSITGAPKEATVSLIGCAEDSPRGWYTGVFGYFDGEEMESAVMIRCIQRGDDGRLYFHSGGGITVNSNCEEEYEELIAKVYLTR